MKPGWFDRLIECVEADRRSARELSREVGGGDNFVQQMVKLRKEPSVSKLEALLDALGCGPRVYVKTGERVAEEDEDFISALLAVPPHLRPQVRQLLVGIAATAAAPAPVDPGKARAKPEEG